MKERLSILSFNNLKLNKIEKKLLVSKTVKNKTKQPVKPIATFSLLGLIKNQRRSSVTEINPLDELTDEIVNDLKLVQTNDYKEDLFYSGVLLENADINHKNGKKIKLVELIFHILKKNKKSENEILITKLYFLKMDRLVSLLAPLKINISDMLSKLVCQIKCEKKGKDNILFRAGDIGEKLYILIKGIVGILIKKEINIECTHLEFLKYLIVLHLYQEDNLVIEIILKNHGNINVDKYGFFTLLHIFKFYYFLKQNNRLSKNYDKIYDFISGEPKLRAYIHKKCNFSAMLAFEIPEYNNNVIEQLYEFYCRKIKEINKSIRYGVAGRTLIANFIKRQIRPSIMNKPQTQEELLNFLKLYDEGKKKFKSNEEFYQKISGINEISPNKIASCSVERYVQRLDFNNIYKLIQEDTKMYYKEEDLIEEEKLKLKTNIFYEINQVTEGGIFGEIALSDPTSKRNATVITKEECYFGTINKKVYDLSLRVAQEKTRTRNILFFTRGPIFKGISNNNFLNKFFYRFKKNSYKRGEILFRKGEPRKEVIFVVKGELELSGTVTSYELTNIITSLGGILDDRYLNYLCNTYYKFNDYYYNSKQNIKFCVLKDKEIIGLEDLTSNGMNIFNCACVSTDKTEVYELDYNIIEEAKSYKNIKNNIIDYVNLKKNLFIRMLLDLRNSLVSKELFKIRKGLDKKNDSENKSLIFSENFLPITKNVKFSENMNILPYNDKNKLEGTDSLLKSKAKSIQKTEKTKYTSINLSPKYKDYESSKLNSINIKKIDMFDKNIKYNYKIISSFRNTSPKGIISKNKNEKNLAIKKSFFDKNSTVYDNNSNSSNITNNNILTDYSNFQKTFKPYIQNSYHSRKKRVLIPFFSNSYNKKKNKKKLGATPVIMKEHHVQFHEMRNNTNINNFYIERQDIFDSLLDNEEEKYRFLSKTDRGKNMVDKTLFDIKKINNLKDKNNNLNSKCNKTEINFHKIKFYNELKNPGFIDCLCLDNWEEKEQFEKRILTEENLF